MAVAQRRLVVVRHAKAAWPDGVPDLQRPLAERGRHDAPAIGRWLAEHIGDPDLVLCSVAVRARQTWELAAAELPAAPPVRYEEQVYDASASTLVDVVAALPDSAATVVLIGHNPALTDFVARLSGQPQELKTSAVAVLSWPGRWVDLEAQRTNLVEYITARGGRAS